MRSPNRLFAKEGVRLNTVEQIKLFMEPRSVALVGVSSRTGMYSFNILENILDLGYQGEVYPVNPNTSNILGKKTYPNILEIEANVDLAVVSTPRSQVPGIIEECIKREIKAIIIVGQGFCDAKDKEGKKLQEKIVRMIRNTETRIIGPNTIGVSNPFVDFSTSFAKQSEIKRLPIGVISQTGMFSGSFPDLNLLGKGIDLGNACDLDFSDCLEYFEYDQDTKIIFLHIEGIKNGRRFMEVAKRVAMKKPILALKTGTSPSSAKLAQSHTGSIIGKNEIWEGVFKQCGIIRIGDFDEIGDLIKAFSHLPLMKGRSIGIISLSGGIGLMAKDACEEYQLNMPDLSPETREDIANISPEWHAINNPVDIWPAMGISKRPFGEVLKNTVETILTDRQIDAVLLIVGAWFESISPPFSEIVLEVADKFKDKPIAWAPYEGWLYKITAREIENKIKKHGKVAVFSSPKRALRALSKLADYSAFQRGE
jgi:acetyltransferase